MQGYKDLRVYEKSYKAAKAIYQLSEEFPKEEIYAITNQIRRASLSIPLNIAEGYVKRGSQREFKRFLEMAIGSSNEVSVLLDFAKDLGYMSEERHEKASREYEEISRMLNVFIQKEEEQSKRSKI